MLDHTGDLGKGIDNDDLDAAISRAQHVLTEHQNEIGRAHV